MHPVRFFVFLFVEFYISISDLSRKFEKHLIPVCPHSRSRITNVSRYVGADVWLKSHLCVNLTYIITSLCKPPLTLTLTLEDDVGVTKGQARKLLEEAAAAPG